MIGWDHPDSTPLEDVRAAVAAADDNMGFRPQVAYVGPDHWIAKDPEAQAKLRAEGWELVVLDGLPEFEPAPGDLVLKLPRIQAVQDLELPRQTPSPGARNRKRKRPLERRL